MEPADFISVEEARELLIKAIIRLSTEKVSIRNAFGRTLAKDVLSAISAPPFSHSTRDGFAVIYNDVSEGGVINVIGEVKAGEVFWKRIFSGQAVRIYTGAPIPVGADTIVMQEYATRSGRALKIKGKDTRLGDYINPVGSQRKKGDIALIKGSVLTPAAIGFLLSLGIRNVEVYKEPRISIIVTGSELQNKGKTLKKGGIYDSISIMLMSALKSINYTGQLKMFSCKDNPAELLTLFKKTIKESDIIITTGGISVGEYDYMNRVFQKSSVKKIFYKVRQRPGKPLYFGKSGRSLVFGLPGNPAASLICFYEYIYPVLRKMKGNLPYFPVPLSLPVTKEFSKKKGLGFFLKAVTDYNSVTLLPNQESYSLDTFSQANCLVYLPEDTTTVTKGQLAEVHCLPSL